MNIHYATLIQNTVQYIHDSGSKKDTKQTVLHFFGPEQKSRTAIFKVKIIDRLDNQFKSIWHEIEIN